jgi:hypothetical protein
MKNEIRHKLASCVRLLSSDKDGEVIASVRGLIRILHSNNEDIHSFASWIQGEEQSPESQLDLDREAVVTCYKYKDLLPRDKDREFIENVVKVVARGHELTPKQRKWAMDLYSSIKLKT